jgi:hypothetical protein
VDLEVDEVLLADLGGELRAAFAAKKLGLFINSGLK